MQGYLDSGLKGKKQWKTLSDSRTSDICKQEDSKYGVPDQAIAMDEDFIVVVKGKIFKSRLPPFHPNCRSRALFVEE